ncbi:hypothetical protein [Litorilituus sediminis]|uniref:Uncharacterized protein n=1 Tax=Litorilituus sediminis TaxID=718192 RepID=A0A4P6P7E1_9GAMM|nr:hypothetical protein [Litorilituus sediminis]QBG36129.1 hypothetical protein EMK97_10605 [Litorilituus sediminis]
MFKEDEKVHTLTSSGATNFRSSKLDFTRNKIRVISTWQRFLFEAWFHLLNCIFFVFISSIILEDTSNYNPYEEIFWIFVFCLFFSTLVRLGLGLRSKVKYFDLEKGTFCVANSFKKYPTVPIADIDRLYMIRFYHSTSNNSYNGYEFTLKTKSGDIYLLMCHSDGYAMKNEIKKLASVLAVPYEILRADEIYQEAIKD